MLWATPPNLKADTLPHMIRAILNRLHTVGQMTTRVRPMSRATRTRCDRLRDNRGRTQHRWQVMGLVSLVWHRRHTSLGRYSMAAPPFGSCGEATAGRH